MSYETHHDTTLTDWTAHPDAYPDLSHCPSCGEQATVPWYDPFAALPEEPVRCEGCDRDLRLPTYVVKDQLCACCKVPEDEADDDVVYVRLETGERICSNCTADLRSFKYEVEVLTLFADWVTDEHRGAINRALFQVSEAFEKEYSFTANANARYGRMGPLPDDEDETEMTLEAVIGGDVMAEEVDLPDELREQAVKQGGDERADGDE